MKDLHVLMGFAICSIKKERHIYPMRNTFLNYNIVIEIKLHIVECFKYVCYLNMVKVHRIF